MIFQDACRIANVTGLKLKIYYYDTKRDFYNDVAIEYYSDFVRFDPIILMSQLRCVSEESWKGGFNLMKYIDTKLKYISENELMLQVDANTWDPKIREIETKSHLVYFRKNEDWKRVKSSSDEAYKIFMKYVAEMI